MNTITFFDKKNQKIGEEQIPEDGFVSSLLAILSRYFSMYPNCKFELDCLKIELIEAEKFASTKHKSVPTKIKSSFIESIDTKYLKVLELKVQDRSISYFDVPEQLINKILIAESPGKVYNEEIKGKYKSLELKK